MKRISHKFAGVIASVFIFTLILVPFMVKGSAPVPINSWTDLNNVRNSLDASYILTKDLLTTDLDYVGIGDSWQPIGDGSTPFAGSFAGNNFKVQGLVVSSAAADIGFFGVSTGDISNLELQNASVTALAGNQNSGILMGSGGGSITNVSTSGVLHGELSDWESGGLIGWYTGGTIDNSSSTADVSAYTNVGGLVGYMGNGTDEAIINGSSFTGTVVSTDSYTGGMVGYLDNNATIDKSSVNASVTGTDTVGGLVGQMKTTSRVTKSFSEGDVVGSASGVGGFVGDSGAGTILDSYSTGNVVGQDYVGGFAGLIYGTVGNCYSTGTVSSDFRAGGFVGYGDQATITNSFSTGLVTADTFIGGFSGIEANTFAVSENLAWLKRETGPQTCFPEGDGTGCVSADNTGFFIGNSTNQPMAAWDFSNGDGDENDWATVVNDYPVLAWELPAADTTNPTYQNLPGDTKIVNLTEGELIKTNPYIIKVKPNDDIAVEKVEFYVDGNLICTDTTADSEGIYSCSWDTSKYHSNIRVVAYDTSGNTVELTRSVVVDPSLYTLPKTGMNLMDYLRVILNNVKQILSL